MGLAPQPPPASQENQFMLKSVPTKALVIGLVGVVALSGSATAAKAKKKPAKTVAKTTAAKAAPAATAPATTVAAAAGGGDAKCSKTGGTFRDGWNFAASDSTHYDPGLNTELIGAQVNNMMYDGLTRVNALTGKVQADVAESYSANANATVWTFKIRKGVKFSNGEDVLPSTFKKSWDRNVAPSFGSEYASLANIIDGYDAVADGKAKEMNVDANDATMTLVVNLARPYGLFPNIVTHNFFFPLPKQAMEMGADWETKGQLVGNGAFKLEKHAQDQSARLVRNDTYFGGLYGQKACLDAVDMKVSKDPLVAYNDFLAGNTDGGPIPVGKWKEATAKYGDKAAPPILSIGYLGFNWNDKTVGGFANTKLRQAIQASIDRDQIIEVINQGSVKPALGFTPPGISGFKAGLSKQPANSKADKALAKKLFDEWSQGKPAPKIEYHYRNNSAAVTFAQLLQAQVKDAIGLELTLKPEVPRGFFARLGVENYQMFQSGWIFDYNGYDNGMNELFATADDTSNNSSDFSVADFDKLVTSAKSEPDPAKSAAQFNQAEALLLDTAIVIPTTWGRNQNVITEKVGTYPITAFGFVEFQLVTMK
jgi:oligopeptide transport system substrate-binding protein